MFRVLIQVLDEADREVFSASLAAEKSHLIKEGYETPGLQDVVDLLASAIES